MITKKNIVTSVLLSIITCGIYAIYWMYRATDDSITLSEQRGTQGGMVVFLSIITCGIYGIYWCYIMDKRLAEVEAKRRITSKKSTVIYMIFYVLGIIVTLALIQNRINNIIES